MSEPLPEEEMATQPAAPQEDDPMQGSGQEDEGEGDAVGGGDSDDSSEEPEEDAEEEMRVREGFIVDEDEDEDDEDDEAERRRRRKRRKRKHRREIEADDGLEEDDLELLAENTGDAFKSKQRLTRLRRGRSSDSPPPSSSRRKAVVESSEDDLDLDGGHLPQVQDIQRIWDDERGGKDDEDDLDDDMDNFIDYDDPDEAGDGAGQMDEAERDERRRERREAEKKRRKAMGLKGDMAGIDALAWDEIHDVFGDGHEYDWALVGDDEVENEELVKPDMKYQDVFEPSEIRARLLTEDDDLIRQQDIPERMQLATSSLSRSSTLSLREPMTEGDIDEAATWITPRLSDKKTQDFFASGGQYNEFQSDLVLAVSSALRYLFIQKFEVPYIWTHKRDYISYFNPENVRARVELLSLADLWRIYSLGEKFRSLAERRRTLEAAYIRLGVDDDHYTQDIQSALDSIEIVADTTEWLAMKYKDKKKDSNQFQLQFHDDDEEAPEGKKRKAPSRISAYEVAKKSVLAKLAQGFGIQAHQIVSNFVAEDRVQFVDDMELNPVAYAEQFADPDPAKALPVEEILRRARMIVATELGKNPLLRQEMRETFKRDGYISVVPTDRGIAKIDEHDGAYNFKYLLNKKACELTDTPQFLNILAAESAHLVTVAVTLSPDAKAQFERRLNEAFASDSFSDTARAWNEERSLVVQEAIEQHLIPVGVKWTREWIREEVEDFLAARCGDELRDRISAAPFSPPGGLPEGSAAASVLAVSWGKGDPKQDAITMVFLDEAGRLRDHSKIDNLVEQELRDEFADMLRRRRPDVIVIGGFSMATSKLYNRIKEVLQGNAPNAPAENAGWGEQPTANAQAFDIPLIYVHDTVARLYQHSNRAAEEFSALPPTAKYCVGLARYAQSPLNEYAALGSDISAIAFDEHQPLIPQEKLLTALERALVDVVNQIGVDINRAVVDSYYQLLLPFVCGLGPRKAQALAKKIGSMGGNLVNRDQFVKSELLTMNIFLNSAGFLRIAQDMVKPAKNRHAAEDDVQDPLDATRIHPEDYELARKMATDALELDEEDVHDEHPSHVISLIMQDPENDKKLNELNLDEFAINMYEQNQDRKRHTLKVIREELLHPFAEQRTEFPLPSPWEVVTMLSGESPRTLRVGLIVSVQVIRTAKGFVAVRLDSGLEGIINIQYLSDHPVSDPSEVVKKGATIQGVIIDVKLENDQVYIELSSRPTDVAVGDANFRRVKHDDAWDHQRETRDKEMLARKKRAEVDKSRRVIKHPNFHNFNSAQAEAYLDRQPPGEVVIRPSSKGIDHLAVTWKVEDKLYQHIDVTEPNADPTGQTVGSQLIVDKDHQYADLDELIVNHVQAIARRVEDLMRHEKFKPGPPDELHLFLKHYVAANPAKSMYGFTLNRSRPGHFQLCFLANKGSAVQTWPVRVAPEAYYLFDVAAPGVPELCDAFKVRHLHESKNLGGAGGKTPYGAGGRTPARTPGHATPGRMSVRQPARTPNPYNTPAPNPGGATPAYPAPSGYGMPPPAPYNGYQTPSYPARPPDVSQQPPGVPPGMNPQRAAMIQSGGWQSSEGRGW